MVKGDVPGEYYHTLYQVATGRYRISVIKTTDYWNTYTEVGVVYDGPVTFTETAMANLGSGKFIAFTRNNVAGTLTTFESTNSCATWLRRPSYNLNSQYNLSWWTGGGPEIPYVYVHDGLKNGVWTTNGVFDVFWTCRDAGMMLISRNNTVEANFGNTYPIFNPAEVYALNKGGTGGNPTLGYGQELVLEDTRFLLMWSKEYSTTKANLQWTFDNLTYDNIPGSSLPVTPIKVSGITTTSFRIDIQYSDTAWQKVHWCTMDLSTDSTFSSFTTCKYRAVSAFPTPTPIQNTWVNGPFVIFNVLNSNTTYYLRTIAHNYNGQSSPTVTIVKTNALP
jgi:hypothetical protein